jgi:hypothetical protein
MNYAERKFLWCAISLAEIARRTRDHDVLRTVAAAANEWDQMIDRVFDRHISLAVKTQTFLHFQTDQNILKSRHTCCTGLPAENESAPSKARAKPLAGDDAGHAGGGAGGDLDVDAAIVLQAELRQHGEDAQLIDQVGRVQHIVNRRPPRGLLMKAADLKSRLDETGARADAPPLASDTEPPSSLRIAMEL